jgi:PhnB protein
MIMSKIQTGPFVNFQGRAREAMQFYHKVLGGKLELQSSDEQGGPRPAGPGDSIRHSRLEADGVLIIATDGHPDYPAKVGDNVAIALSGTDKDRLAKIFNDLAEGGKIKMPLGKLPGGAEVGWLTDKFGINWSVTIDTQ